MWLRKDQGGTQIGPYSWPEDGSVCEVDGVTGQGLLAIADSGFTPVPAPEDSGEPGSGDGEPPSRGRRRPAARPPAA